MLSKNVQNRSKNVLSKPLDIKNLSKHVQNVRNLHKNNTLEDTSGLTFKILLLFSIPVGYLVPRCRKNFHVYQQEH